VEKLVYGGDALARLDGRVTLAPFALPGERIRAAAEREKPGLIHARTVEVLEPSPDRVAPACPYFGQCGGCHYQHAGYEFQLAAKRGILAEELRRLGKIEPPEIAVVSAEPWAYRNRAQFHVEGGRVGYREARSRKLRPVETCPIASPKLNQALAALNVMARDLRWPRFARSIEIFTDEHQVQVNVLETDRPVARRFFDWCAESIPGFAPAALDYQGRFRVSRNSFFQVNRFLAERLVLLALEGAAGESALDLYAGVGLFSIEMARRFARVTAVESGSAAAADLAFNAERAGFTNVHAHRGKAESYLESLQQAPDFVLADPPRAGLGKAVTARLIALRPKLLTLVSCDPATLARDLAALTEAGYRIDAMTLVDLFPQTFHLETVVRCSAPSPLPAAT